MTQWEQDPAGNWHRKSRVRDMVVVGMIVLVVAIYGFMKWNDNRQRDEQLRQIDREACELSGRIVGDPDPC